MKKNLFILVFTGLCIENYCNAQEIKVVTPSTNKSTGMPSKSPRKTNPISYPKTTGTTKSAIKPVNQSVSITANEDCTLKINGEAKVSLKKGQAQNISLSYNTYKIEAMNTVTGYQKKFDLIVNGSTKAVRIDFSTPIIARDQSIRDSLNWEEKPKTEKPAHDTALDTFAALKSKNAERKIVSMIAENMVKIPPGSFTMGNNLGANDEGPEHSVTIGAIAFSKHEVTQQQWKTIMGSNPSLNQGCDDCPVENVSFYEIDSFLTKINQIGSKKFRLPTEAEWEYVARKGGDSEEMKQRAWYKANSEKKTHPVGAKQPNGFGIYDMSGNVAEWCSDWYALNYYNRKPMDNPVGPAIGRSKVIRGGSFGDSEGLLRFSYRANQYPGSKKETIGLRLVMELK